MADWSSMPKEIVSKIAEHLDFYEDFETLQWVCSRWRVAGKEANFREFINSTRKSSLAHEHTLPWLMLPEKDDSMRSRRVYSLSKGMSRHIINLPDPIHKHYKDDTRLLSSHGWLLVVSPVNELSLYNPFSGSTIQLPIIELQRPLQVVYTDNRLSGDRYNKLFLSANPSTTSDFIVLLSMKNPYHYSIQILVYWRNGSEGWIQVDYPCCPFCDITFYQGEFYGVNLFGTIVKFETAQGNPHYEEINEWGYVWNREERWIHYLVESVGRLLIVRQLILAEENKIRSTARFEVRELDTSIINGEVKAVHSLGDRAIFIGSNSSFSMDVSYGRGFKTNCIYYAEDRTSFMWYGRSSQNKESTCLYNLADGMIETFYNGPSKLGKLTPLMWVESPISSSGFT